MFILNACLGRAFIADWLSKAKEYRLARQCLHENGANIVNIHIEQPGNVTVGDTDIGGLIYSIISGFLSFMLHNVKLILQTSLTTTARPGGEVRHRSVPAVF